MENKEKVVQIMKGLNNIILGKEDVISQIMAAFLCEGHVLLEDVPGVGKTTMALAFSKAMGFDCKRVQFTPDVLPSDLTGFSIYRKEKDAFVYQKGSVFCNLLLADEINRTSPKTQSALLEVMEERQVTTEGVTREVPNPFIVIATQNPIGSVGTQMLPLAQLDRFMICTSMGYPDLESELEMAKGISSATKIEELSTFISIEEFQQMKEEVSRVYIDDAIYEYIVKLIAATRKHPYIEEGCSPRGTIALVKMSQAACWLLGKTFVSPIEVMHQYKAVVYHRMQLNPKAQIQNISKEQVIREILDSVEKPTLWG